MRRRITRVLGRLCMAALAGAVTMSVLAPGTGAVVLPQSFVALNGEGAWSVSQELVSWQNELSTASSSIKLNYAGRGSLFGREDLISGQADFAISGVPFTAEELAKVKGGAGAFIAAPIAVATLAMFVDPPFGQFATVKVICDPDDPSTWPSTVTDPDGCVQRGHLSGALRIPNQNLAGMLLNYNGTGDPLTFWNNGDLTKANGVDQFELTVTNPGPAPIGRSDPDETTYYLQQFVKAAEPTVWQGNQGKLFHPSPLWEPVSERLPENVGITRDGAEQQVDQLEGAGLGGGIAAAPPSMIRSFHSTFPGEPIMTADMQNANGDWVAPTPDSINKAVDAGGDTPLFALTNKVPGAYPLVWVDSLYAPAHGLSIAKTEGIAMLIRYLATTGQDQAAPVGEGRLPASVVPRALQAADDIVVSNCQGSDRRLVVSSDPGPLAPPAAKAMRSIGPMAHCEPVTPPTSSTSSSTTSTTTVTPTTFSSTGIDQSGGSPSDIGSAVGGVSSPTVAGGSSPATSGASSTVVPGGPATSGGSGATPSGRSANALLTASELPLPAPGSSAPGSDRLATFILGVGLYLLLRKPFSRLARRIVT